MPAGDDLLGAARISFAEHELYPSLEKINVFHGLVGDDRIDRAEKDVKEIMFAEINDGNANAGGI